MVEQKPINVNFVASSGTTYTDKDPSFIVLHVDKETLLPVNVESHYFDLAYANKNDEPKWVKLMEYLDYFKIPDLSPDSIMKVAENVLYNGSYAQMYDDFHNVIPYGGGSSPQG